MTSKLLSKKLVGVTVSVAIFYRCVSYCTDLSDRYPSHTLPATSRMWVPNKQEPHHPTYVPRDLPVVFYARIPRSSFGERFELEDARKKWATAFFNGTLIKTEGKIIAWLSGGAPARNAFAVGDQLVGGALVVVEPPSRTGPLLTRWELPPAPVRFFESLARYGYPWRLMEGGRHDFPVVLADNGDVLVGFSAAHDYAVLDNDGKVE